MYKVFNSKKFKSYDESLQQGQAVFKFKNGFGASVVCNQFSYGSADGLFELAVLKFDDAAGTREIVYDTPITNDVEGYLNDDEVDELLEQIAAIPEGYHAGN